MPKNSSQNVENQSNIIRNMMSDNKTDRQIIRELNMPEQTFYLYKRRIQKIDEKIWDKGHIHSAKYRATMLLQSLEECYHINRQIATNEKNKPKDRIQASETMCLALTHIFKIVNDGPVINPSFPNKSRSITYRP